LNSEEGDAQTFRPERRRTRLALSLTSRSEAFAQDEHELGDVFVGDLAARARR
jgi:hypothetical protein